MPSYEISAATVKGTVSPCGVPGAITALETYALALKSATAVRAAWSLLVSSAAACSFPSAHAARKALAVAAVSFSVTGPLPLVGWAEASAFPPPCRRRRRMSPTRAYTPYPAPPTIARNTPPMTAPFATPFT